MWKRSRNALQVVVVELLLLMRDVLAFARIAHAVALDGLREDHGRAARVVHGLVVRGVHLHGVVTAAVQVPDVLVGQVRDHRLELGIAPEEVLARVRAALRLERLILAVDALFHRLAEQPVLVAREQRIPARAPDDFDDVPARALIRGLELLDDLAVAAHRTVEALQVAVDHEDQVVELLAHRHRDRAHRLGLVRLAVAEEAPDLAVLRRQDAAVLEIAHEARLVDRHHRAEAHRHGRELPELRHQPRMRVRRQPGAHDLLAEVIEVLLGEPPFEERARVDARRRVTLEEHEVAAVLGRRRAPKMVEADFVERGRRRVARDVAAVLGALAVRVDDHRHRVPADVGLDPPLDRAIAGILGLLADGDRVEVGGVRAIRQVRAGTARVIDHAFEQEVRALGAVNAQHRVDRLEPVLRLLRIGVVTSESKQRQWSCARHTTRYSITRRPNSTRETATTRKRSNSC